MSTTDDEVSDASMFAQLTMEPELENIGGYGMTSPETVFLRVAVPATAKKVTVSFDPVSVEEMRQTRELNRSIRLGFVPPTASTR